MTRHGSVKRYWSGIKNFHQRALLVNEEGRNARKEIYGRTGLKKFKESVFQKNLRSGKTLVLKDSRRAWKIIHEERDKQLKKDWLESKKAGNKESFSEFQRANIEPDWEKIRELFNSPT